MIDAIPYVSIIISVISLIFSVIAVIIVLALKFSTHKIEWRAYESPEQILSEEEEKVAEKKYDKNGKEIDPLVEGIKKMYSDNEEEYL